MEKEIVIKNWHPEDPVIYKDDLSWRKDDCRDAESTDPQSVFTYYWKHFNSIVFYYLGDGNFYELFMENYPFKFWRIQERKIWNGKWICEKISWNDHEEGEVLFTFDDDTDLWNTLTLYNLPIGEILNNSVIAEINI